MLQIGCPKAKFLKEKIDGIEFEGIKFKAESTVGLTLKVSHNGESDSVTKSVVKKLIATLPELKSVYTNIQIIDENGRII